MRDSTHKLGSIPSSSAKTLNELLQQVEPYSQNMARLNQPFLDEEEGLQIQIAHNRFMDYLKKRLGHHLL